MSSRGRLSIPAHIFRGYDIRGIVGPDLTEDTYYNLGRAYGTFLWLLQASLPVASNASKRLQVVCGCDARLSSQHFQGALLQGIAATGVDAIDLGEVPTPVLCFAVKFLDTDGGAEVTASHNAADYNGLKLRKRTRNRLNAPLAYEDLQELRQIIESGQFHDGQGSITQFQILPEYMRYVAKKVKCARSLKVVLDGGNGVAGPTALSVYRALGCDVTGIYIEPDGRFPNHLPDPLKEENMVDLAAKVKEISADIGIGIDGDGDRLGIVSDTGEMILPDRYMVLFTRKVLERKPNSPIIFDMKCSLALSEDIERHGGRPVMCPTGYTNVFDMRLQTGAPFAGEFSGHMFFDDPIIDFDDGIFAGAKMLEALSDGDAPISERFRDVPRYWNTPEGRIYVGEEVKVQLIEELKQELGLRYTVISTDGVRVIFPTGWALLRVSNTEPAIAYRFESTKSDEDLSHMMQLMRDELARKGVRANF